MLAKEDMIRDIRKGVAVLQSYIDPGGKLNLTDTNVQAEDFVAGLLNATFGWTVVNANRGKANYPCIDLIDEDRKLGVQVTSEKGSAKLSETLQCLERHGLREKVSHLKVFSLVPKQERYTVDSRCPGIAFDWKTDLLDFTDVLKGAQAISNLEHLRRVHRCVIDALPTLFPEYRQAAPSLRASLAESRQDRLRLMLSRSLARCEIRWQAAGVPGPVAKRLAADPTIGAPGEPMVPSAERPIVVLVGPIGAGKSLTGERIHQDAIRKALTTMAEAITASVTKSR